MKTQELLCAARNIEASLDRLAGATEPHPPTPVAVPRGALEELEECLIALHEIISQADKRLSTII